MAEGRQTIIERVARFVMELVGAEEVEERIEEVDAEFQQMASRMQSNIKIMNELSASLRTVGKTMSGTVLQQLPQTTKFLEQYAIAGEKAEASGKELSLAMYVQSEEGTKLASSLGLVTPKLEETAEGAGGAKDAFWSLNSAARALLRIFVGFKILVGMLGFLKEMAEASFNLQAELWRLRATVEGVSDEMEGGAGTWEEWVSRLERLRAILPLVNMTELVEGLRKLTGVLGPLGLTADEIERVTGLVGQMATVMGEDFPSYISQFVTALGGGQRNVANFGIDLRDGNQALVDYAEGLGFVWDELNAGQRQWIRLGFFVQEATDRTVGITDATAEEWQELEKLRKERDDILAQSPELIATQIKWAEILLGIAQLLERLVGLVPQYTEKIRQLIDVLGLMIPPVKNLIVAWDEWQEHLEEQRVYKWIDSLKEPWQEMDEVIGDFDETVKENAEALADAGDDAEEFGKRMASALQQARNALRSYQNAVADAGINLARRLADIARNLEERLADLESRFEARRDQLIQGFEERRAEIREDGAEREEELRKDLNKRLRRMEEDHQNEMRELREDYLLDLEEAARKRDAVSMRRIQQRYILEKKQRERDHEINRRRAIEDYHDQLDELKKAREEQERELEKSLERQLRELQENYERQQEEARLNAERQKEDALRNYQEQLDDLWRNFQDRLETIALNLMEEEEEWKDHLGDLRIFFDEWYEDDLTALKAWLARRALILRAQEWIESLPPWMRPFIPPIPQVSMAQGGAGVARSPAQITVGDAGPEVFAAWPLGQRMPRLGADIRLTIDGTQTGGWSAGFENQVIRILREVLEEAL